MWKCHSFYQIKWITRFLIQLFCYTYASLGSIRGSKRSLTLKVIWQEVQVWRSSVFFLNTSSTDTDDVADLFLSILLKYLLQSKNGRSGLYLNAASQTFPISPPCRGPSQHSVSLEQTGTEASLWDKEYNVLVASSSSTSASAGNLIFCYHFEKHDISCYGETHTQPVPPRFIGFKMWTISFRTWGSDTPVLCSEALCDSVSSVCTSGDSMFPGCFFFSCWWRWLWWTTLVQPFRKGPLDPAEDSECDLSVLVLFYSQFCDVLSPVWAPLTFGTGKMILHCQVVVGSLWRLVDVTDCFLFFFCFLARCLAPLQPGNEPVYGVKILGWYSVLEERKKGQEN